MLNLGNQAAIECYLRSMTNGNKSATSCYLRTLHLGNISRLIVNYFMQKIPDPFIFSNVNGIFVNFDKLDDQLKPTSLSKTNNQILVNEGDKAE